MAASLKVSELSALSSVAAADLLLIADASATASKKVTLTNLEGSMSLANLGTRAISDLSNVASTSPSSGQVLAYNGSAWAPADNTTKADLDVDHLITLSGVSAAADDLGTFSGSTITDSSTVKTALQALETAVESASSAAATVATAISDTLAIVAALSKRAAPFARDLFDTIYVSIIMLPSERAEPIIPSPKYISNNPASTSCKK